MIGWVNAGGCWVMDLRGVNELIERIAGIYWDGLCDAVFYEFNDLLREIF